MPPDPQSPDIESPDRAGPNFAGPGFAALLRHRRRVAGLTQAELAQLSGLAVRTVREAERGRTNRPQRSTAMLLADALRLAGPERSGFLGAARGGVPPFAAPRPRAAAEPGAPGRLPAAPALVGRDGERDQLAQLLCAGGGPVSLVGVPGVGKSALALAVAHASAAQPLRFPGGVAWVPVGPGAGAGDLQAAVGAGLAGFPTDRADRLPQEPALVLFDAADHAAAAVRTAVARLPPTVRVVVTSRVPLALPTGQVRPVLPLPVPPVTAARELSQVADHPAAAMFLEQLAQVRPDPVTAEEVPALVGLVRRVGGLPLALTLAARHGRLLRMPELLRRYGHRVLDLGEGGPWRLREAMADGYHLLSPVERAALRRLAVFRGRWSVELAEQLLTPAAGGDPVPLLDRLVTVGLVSAAGGREHRFRLSPVVRDFLREQAARQDDLADARRAHAAVVADAAERAAPALVGSTSAAALSRLDELASETWAALSFAANPQPVTALRLATALVGWWRHRGRAAAGRQWLRRLLDDPRTADAAPGVRAAAQVGLARLACADGDGGSELAAARAGLAGYRALGDVAGELAAGRVLNAACVAAGRYQEGRHHVDLVLAAAIRHGRWRDAGLAQLSLAWHDLRVGEVAAARRRLAGADRLAARAGDRRLQVRATAASAELCRLSGAYERAVTTGRRVSAVATQVGDPASERRALGTVGQALAALGRVGEAQRVLAMLRAAGDRPPGGSSQAGQGAAIEARLALTRGDRAGAAEWFGAVVADCRGGDRRELLGALVDLAACLPASGRQREVLAEIEQLCRTDGFVLLDRERTRLRDLPG